MSWPGTGGTATGGSRRGQQRGAQPGRCETSTPELPRQQRQAAPVLPGVDGICIVPFVLFTARARTGRLDTRLAWAWRAAGQADIVLPAVVIWCTLEARTGPDMQMKYRGEAPNQSTWLRTWLSGNP